MTRTNQSWREQRKGLIANYYREKEQYISLWQASHKMAKIFGCKADTAKKEIKKAIVKGAKRYDRRWQWIE